MLDPSLRTLRWHLPLKARAAEPKSGPLSALSAPPARLFAYLLVESFDVLDEPFPRFTLTASRSSLKTQLSNDNSLAQIVLYIALCAYL